MYSLIILSTRASQLTEKSYEHALLDAIAHTDGHGRPVLHQPTHLVVGANRAMAAHAIAKGILHRGTIEVLVIEALGDVWALADLRNWPVADGDTVAVYAAILRVHEKQQARVAG